MIENPDVKITLGLKMFEPDETDKPGMAFSIGETYSFTPGKQFFNLTLSYIDSDTNSETSKTYYYIKKGTSLKDENGDLSNGVQSYKVNDDGTLLKGNDGELTIIPVDWPVARPGYSVDSDIPDTIESDMEIRWVPNTYDIIFDKNGGTGDMESQSFTYDAIPTELRENTFTRTGYTFAGWADSSDGEVKYLDKQQVQNITTVKDDDVTLFAIWTANTYSVSFNANGGTGEMTSQTFTYDTAQVLSANTFTRDSYTFNGWNTKVDGSGIAYADKAEVKNLAESGSFELFAQWKANQPSGDSNGGSTSKPSSKPSKPNEPDTPVEPETPASPGDVTVETKVTDGGEVEFEAPVEEPVAGEVGTPAEEDEAKITGVVLPQGTDSEVAFVPISEQPAPAGKETQTKKVFEINVPTYEKGKASTVKFQMTVKELEADGKTAADVALWHFDEETGEWTKLVTSYTIVDGIVYFEAITYDFSPFAIIYEDEPANEPVDEPETPASPAPLFAVLAALGAAVVLRRK